MSSRMLYKRGDAHNIWGISCDYAIFNSEDVKQAIEEGWVLNPHDLEVLEPEPPNKTNADADGEISYDEAKAYAEDNGLDISGIHWKKAVSIVKDHMNGNSND